MRHAPGATNVQEKRCGYGGSVHPIAAHRGNGSVVILIRWFISTVAVLVAAYLLPGVQVANFFVALVVAVVLGFANAVLRPILLMLTLPITLLTLGLFALAVNALLVLVTAAVVPGFAVDGFWWALLYSVVLAIVSGVLKQVEPRPVSG